MAKENRNPETESDTNPVTSRFTEQSSADDVVDEEVQNIFNDEQNLVPVEARLEETAKRGSGREAHKATSPTLSGGDVDAAWERADVGEETVGGTNPTPDQDRVDELGAGAGLVYQDEEPLHTRDKLEQRDRERWELNPASSEDYEERLRREFGKGK
jgi:hypothetical protein